MDSKHKFTMTVIIPSYNNGEYISDAIESILNQERDFSLQIIISDDASTDDSVSVIKSYVAKYPNIIYALYSENNKGLFYNYYKAVKVMDSKYFCVLDPDDYYTDKKRLQKAVDFLEGNDDYTIYSMNSISYNIYTNEETKIYYPDMAIGESHISMLEDFINGKEILCNTPGTTFRNVAYSDQLIDKIIKVSKVSETKAAFRADTGRNLVHLTKGKAMFKNEFVAKYRVHDHNMAQKKKDYEKLIQVAESYIIYNEFFESKYIDRLYDRVYICYRKAIVAYSYALYDINNIISKQSESYSMFGFVNDWLDKNKKWGNKDRNNRFNIRLLKELHEKRFVIWGTGISSEYLIKKYDIKLKDEDFFIDGTYQSGQKGEMFGKRICAAIDVSLDDDYYVLICSSFYNEIIDYIEGRNMCKSNKIINLFAYDRFYGVLE